MGFGIGTDLYSIHFEELSFDVIPNLTGFISIRYVHYFYPQCRHFILNT